MRRETRDYGGNCNHGSNWIRRAKRLRIYARDGFRCVWCQCRVAPHSDPKDVTRPRRRALACLDHVLPRDRGGSNAASNLLTSCVPCNARRGPMSAIAFAFAELRAGVSAADTLNRVIEAMARELPEVPA